MSKEKSKKQITFYDKVQSWTLANSFSPFPAWLKDKNGVMMALNSAYEEIFLIPRGKSAKMYITKTDYDIWPVEIADRYGENDLKIIRGDMKIWVGIEPISAPHGDISTNWIIAKFGIYDDEGNIEGVGGMALPDLKRDIQEYVPESTPDQKVILIVREKIKVIEKIIYQ